MNTLPDFALVSQARGPQGRWAWLAVPPYPVQVWAFFLSEERFLEFGDLMARMTGDLKIADIWPREEMEDYAGFCSIVNSAPFPEGPRQLGVLVLRGGGDFPKFTPDNFAHLTHELVHLTNRLLNDVGVRLDPENDEPSAYVTSELFSALASMFSTNTRYQNNWGFSCRRNVARYAREALK